MPDGGVPDLGNVKALADAREAAAAAEQRKAVEKTARAWDRAMTRTFKGILPAPARRRMLSRAVFDDA